MRRTLLTLGLIAALTACAEDEPEPAVEAERGLEQFSDAIGEMEDRAETLTDEVTKLEAQLREDIDKHLTVLNTRLSDYEERIIALPAEQEARLRQTYSQLIAETGEVRQLYQQWADASGEQADQLRARLKEAREQLDAAFERFEEQLREAEGA